MSTSGSESTAAALAWLEENYDARDRRASGWALDLGLRYGGGRGFYSIKADLYRSCTAMDGAECERHVGAEDYNCGFDVGDYKFHRIPLIKDHYMSPCP